MAEPVVAHGEACPQPQYGLDDALGVLGVAAPVVALALHDADRPCEELPVPVARRREAAAAREERPLSRRQQAVPLHEGQEHLLDVVVRVPEAREGREVGRAEEAHDGPARDVAQPQPAHRRALEDRALRGRRRLVARPEALVRPVLEISQ